MLVSAECSLQTVEKLKAAAGIISVYKLVRTLFPVTVSVMWSSLINECDNLRTLNLLKYAELVEKCRKIPTNI